MSEVNLSYDEIRPYFDDEVPSVLNLLSQKPSFFVLMNYLFPEQTGEEIVERFSRISGVEQFQSEYIQHAIWKILDESSEEVNYQGLDQLEEEKCYLFLSNHRDIILDSAILNVLLKKSGRSTTKIAIGDNLLVSGLVTDLMKLNKSFIVHRDVARQDMIHYSRRLSSYIRDQIVSGQDSVWIAQRNGRAKDGNDITQAGLLKMLNLDSQKPVKVAFKELNIIPMSISYEYDPCDGLKAEELYHQHNNLPYVKDDKLGMVHGIRGNKGRILMTLCRPLNEWIDELPDHSNLNLWLKTLAEAIDREIHLSYKLWPSHYVAADALAGKDEYTSKYSEEDKAAFFAHMEAALQDKQGDVAGLKRQFLEIYANPVKNHEKARAIR